MMKRDAVVVATVATNVTVFGRTDKELREVASALLHDALSHADLPIKVYWENITLHEQLALF